MDEIIPFIPVLDCISKNPLVEKVIWDSNLNRNPRIQGNVKEEEDPNLTSMQDNIKEEEDPAIENKHNIKEEGDMALAGLAILTNLTCWHQPLGNSSK